MQTDSDVKPAQSSGGGALKIILVVVGVIIVLLCLVPICIIAILTLLGPQIANVFSQVTNGLSP